jgi:DNA-binding SARP family transcriptional activator
LVKRIDPAMRYVRTFGGLSVEVDGTPGHGAAQQRKTLALLALLAHAGRRGMSRDRLTAYIWPDSDRDHARGLLKQACYALRRDLRAPGVFLGATELRLDSSIITSDAEAFAEALDRDDQATAAALYSGPFLDGFYLDGASLFERWVEATRDQLHRRACGALEKLATRAAAQGERMSSVEYWRRLASLEPLDARVTIGVMNALAACGDRPGAMRVARAHERLLRDELDMIPEPEIAHLAARLRAAAGPGLD